MGRYERRHTQQSPYSVQQVGNFLLSQLLDMFGHASFHNHFCIHIDLCLQLLAILVRFWDRGDSKHKDEETGEKRQKGTN